MFRVKYCTAKNDQVYIMILAMNGKILFTSETYKNKSHAKRLANKMCIYLGAELE